MEIPTGDEQWGLARVCGFRDYSHRGRILFRGYCGRALLDDARLVFRDCFNGVSKNLRVLQVQRCDNRHHRGDYIRCVEGPSDSYFYNGQVASRIGKRE